MVRSGHGTLRGRLVGCAGRSPDPEGCARMSEMTLTPFADRVRKGLEPAAEARAKYRGVAFLGLAWLTLMTFGLVLVSL